MMNRGFLTRPSISPLGTHKDQTPADLPNQPVAVDTAEFTHEDAITPVKESGPPLRAAASSAPTGTAKRYTLLLKLDPVLHQRLDASLARFGPSSRSAAKRAMLLAFRARLAVTPLNAVMAAALNDAVSYRIDIRLPNQLVSQLLAAAGQSAFEPRATTLARSLAPHFADFVREALGPMPAAASENRVAEPTMGDSTVHR